MNTTRITMPATPIRNENSDGRRVLMIKESGAGETPPQNFVVVQSWFEELRQRVHSGT